MSLVVGLYTRTGILSLCNSTNAFATASCLFFMNFAVGSMIPSDSGMQWTPSLLCALVSMIISLCGGTLVLPVAATRTTQCALVLKVLLLWKVCPSICTTPVVVSYASATYLRKSSPNSGASTSAKITQCGTTTSPNFSCTIPLPSIWSGSALACLNASSTGRRSGLHFSGILACIAAGTNV